MLRNFVTQALSQSYVHGMKQSLDLTEELAIIHPDLPAYGSSHSDGRRLPRLLDKSQDSLLQIPDRLLPGYCMSVGANQAVSAR